jgi:hypothetical protein
MIAIAALLPEVISGTVNPAAADQAAQIAFAAARADVFRQAANGSPEAKPGAAHQQTPMK